MRLASHLFGYVGACFAILPCNGLAAAAAERPLPPGMLVASAPHRPFTPGAGWTATASPRHVSRHGSRWFSGRHPAPRRGVDGGKFRVDLGEPDAALPARVVVGLSDRPAMAGTRLAVTVNGTAGGTDGGFV